MLKRLVLCTALGLGVVSIPADVMPQAPAAATAETAKPATAVPDPDTPSDLTDVTEGVGDVISATRTGSWITIAGAVIMLLMNLLRLPQLGSLTKKIPGRWRTVIAVVLGGVAGILASIAGGVPWYEAIAVGVFSGPTAIASHEVVVNTIMGKREKAKAAG